MKEALRKLREMYPGVSLECALNELITRVNKAEEACKTLKRERDNAILDKYEYDRRYCDILVEKRKLAEKIEKLKGRLNTMYGASIPLMYKDQFAKDFSNLMYEIAKTDPTRVLWNTRSFIFKWPYEQDFEAQLAKFVEDLKNNKAAEIIKISKCKYDVDGHPYAVLIFKMPTGFKEEV